ncbi:MAG: hypothetical protein ACI4JM_11065 [Oscillospiraceae bacterium]
MLKLIKAEFENFDYAEMASIKLRKNIKGIRKIKIISSAESKSSHNNDYHFRLLPTAVTTNNYYTQAVISPNYSTDESNMIKSAVLSIVCTDDAFPAVHNILTSSGGISISSETFIP